MLLQRGDSFSSAPLIRELIIGMVGFLLMKHNLLSATHHPTLHQALSCHCTLYVLSSVISGISWKVGATISGIHRPSNTFSSVWHGWLVLLSQIFMRLCTQWHSSVVPLSQKLFGLYGRQIFSLFVNTPIKLCMHTIEQPFSPKTIYLLRLWHGSVAPLCQIFICPVPTLTAEVGLQGEQFIGISLAKFKGEQFIASGTSWQASRLRFFETMTHRLNDLLTRVRCRATTAAKTCKLNVKCHWMLGKLWSLVVIWHLSCKQTFNP